MKIKKKYTIEIDAVLGSTFQVESLDTFVKCVCQAIEISYGNSHKDNKINIILDIK